MNVLFERIVAHVPPPTIEENAPFRMLATTLEADPYLGRLLTGRILSGSIKHAAQIKALHRDGSEIERARVSKLLAYRSEEHTSELQSLMRISYAVFCLKKKKDDIIHANRHATTTHK